MKKGKVHIGTSGWHYKHWRGTFYPADIKSASQFEYYSRLFQTVEINNSFYKLPDKATFAAWREAAPRGFVFAVKASRFITHMKKLKVDPESISRFFTHSQELEKNLGPILFQLPPHWKVNPERLNTFLQHLPRGFSYTIEFRNATWYTEEVYAILNKHDVAFCIYELDGHLSPLEVTAGFVYIRLHGPGAKYQGSYSEEVLKSWAAKIKSWSRKGKDVFIYFDNDQEGYAAFNALALLKMIPTTSVPTKRSQGKASTSK
jgi:uncharacterized protein YecE (DUF72 family)